jgi:hypothetical protein
MRYLRTFLRHWYLYVLPILVLPVVFFEFGYHTGIRYTSTATILVSQPIFLPPNGFGWDSTKTPAQNEVLLVGQFLSSKSFVTEVASLTNLVRQYNLTTSLGQDEVYAYVVPEVTIAPSTIGPAASGPNIFTISAADRSPLVAQQLASSLVAVYKAHYTTHRLSEDNQAIAFYTQQQASEQSAQTQALNALSAYVAARPSVVANGDARYNLLNQNLQSATNELNKTVAELALLQQDVQATHAGGNDIIQVQDAPTVAVQPSVRKLKFVETYGGIGLAIAAGLVAGIVTLLTMLDRRIYAPADLQAMGAEMEIELPPLEILPTMQFAISRGRALKGDKVGEGIGQVLLPIFVESSAAGIERQEQVSDNMDGSHNDHVSGDAERRSL